VPSRTDDSVATRQVDAAPSLPRARHVIHEELRDALAEAPDAELVRFVDLDGSCVSRWTRRQIWEESLALAHGLRRRGVGRGDRIVMMLENRPEFLVAWFASSMLGAISVPLNTSHKGAVLEHMISGSGCSVIVCEPALVATVEAASGANANDPILVVVDDEDASLAVGPARHVSWSSIVAENVSDAEVIVDSVDPWDTASIMYTSGTTGRSKGVVCSHRAIMRLGEVNNYVLGHGPEDVSFSCLPLFHGNALWTSFLAGLIGRSRIVIAPRFSASRFWAQVSRTEATVLSLLGAMGNILQQCDPNLSERDHRVRIALCVPVPEDREGFEKRFGFPLTEVYGSTDSGIVIGTPAGQSRPGSCGRALPDCELDVVDDFDQPVPPGTPGELVFRPGRPWIMPSGYWGMPEESLGVWRNLWLHTGDYVQRDVDGWFSFVDRKKDAIRRAGENISSVEVEEALLGHEAISEVAVYGVPSELGEQEVMAAVVTKQGHDLELRALLTYCEERLAYFAIPRFYRLIDELPHNRSQRVDKVSLRAEGTDGAWDAGPRGRTARATVEGPSR